MPQVIGGPYRFVPPTNVRLNQQHPLNRGLIGLLVGRVVHVGATRGGVKGDVNFVRTGFGDGVSGNTLSKPPLCTLPAQSDSSTFTMAWAGSGTGTAFCLGVSTNGANGTNVITPSGWTYTGNTGFQTSTSFTTPGRDFVVVVVKNGLAMSVFVATTSGVTKIATTATSGQVSLISQSMYYGPDDFETGNPTSLGAVWTRALTDAEARSLVVNPFQMMAA